VNENIESGLKSKEEETLDDRVWSDVLRRLKRSGWIILICLSLASLYWRSGFIFAGVFIGGLISVLGFYQLHGLVSEILSGPKTGVRFRFHFQYLIRLSVFALIIIPLVVFRLVHPVGLLVGLSVAVINILTFGIFFISRVAYRESQESDKLEN
jgi:hypothetical protein